MSTRPVRHEFFAKDATANAQWVAFSKRIFSFHDPGIVQYRETKRAFYAGMVATQSILMGLAELPDEQGVDILSNLRKETEDFFRSELKEFRASRTSARGPSA